MGSLVMEEKSYSRAEEQLARFAKAMGHPDRHPAFFGRAGRVFLRRYPSGVAHFESDRIPASEGAQGSRPHSRGNPSAESEVLHPSRELGVGSGGFFRLLLCLCPEEVLLRLNFF